MALSKVACVQYAAFVTDWFATIIGFVENTTIFWFF